MVRGQESGVRSQKSEVNTDNWTSLSR
jgi:hypothetical protein